RAANYALGCINDPLEHFPLSHCTAGVPHTDAVIMLPITLIKGSQQSLCDVIVPKHPQEAQFCGVFLSSSEVFKLQVRSFSMWTPRMWKSATLSTQFSMMISCEMYLFLVNYYLLFLGDVEKQVVCAPPCPYRWTHLPQ
ncbi:hypothetical protein GOODEAATRI_026121, partial [Goodea atripinnis]